MKLKKKAPGVFDYMYECIFYLTNYWGKKKKKVFLGIKPHQKKVREGKGAEEKIFASYIPIHFPSNK